MAFTRNDDNCESPVNFSDPPVYYPDHGRNILYIQCLFRYQVAGL